MMTRERKAHLQLEKRWAMRQRHTNSCQALPAITRKNAGKYSHNCTITHEDVEEEADFLSKIQLSLPTEYSSNEIDAKDGSPLSELGINRKQLFVKIFGRVEEKFQFSHLPIIQEKQINLPVVTAVKESENTLPRFLRQIVQFQVFQPKQKPYRNRPLLKIEEIVEQKRFDLHI